MAPVPYSVAGDPWGHGSGRGGGITASVQPHSHQPQRVPHPHGPVQLWFIPLPAGCISEICFSPVYPCGRAAAAFVCMQPCRGEFLPWLEIESRQRYWTASPTPRPAGGGTWWQPQGWATNGGSGDSKRKENLVCPQVCGASQDSPLVQNGEVSVASWVSDGLFVHALPSALAVDGVRERLLWHTRHWWGRRKQRAGAVLPLSSPAKLLSSKVTETAAVPQGISLMCFCSSASQGKTWLLLGLESVAVCAHVVHLVSLSQDKSLQGST